MTSTFGNICHFTKDVRAGTIIGIISPNKTYYVREIALNYIQFTSFATDRVPFVDIFTIDNKNDNTKGKKERGPNQPPPGHAAA